MSLKTYDLTNTGDAELEGHTPQTFMGQGAGLFASDEINTGFPAGDATQIFLTIPLDGGQGNNLTKGNRVALNAWFSAPTENIAYQGDPYSEMGDLVVHAVGFNAFSASVWDLEPSNPQPACVLATAISDELGCDLSDAVQDALDNGDDALQLRIRFDGLSAANGGPDGVYFTLANSSAADPGNTAEADTFTLTVDAVKLLPDDE